MDVKEITALVSEGIHKLTDTEYTKKILNRQNNLFKYDLANRIAILMQNDKAYDLRTYDEWLSLGRKVRKKQKPIFIMIPNQKFQYIDTENGEVINDNDLTVDEFNKALEYKLIKRVETTDNFINKAVYDIRQTKANGENKYVIPKPILTSANIIDTFIKITNANIEICDTNYYSVSDNVLYLEKDNYGNLAATLAKILTQYEINNIKNNDRYTVLLDDAKEQLENAVLFSISTLFNCNIQSELDTSHLDTEISIKILEIVDNIIEVIIQKMKFNINESVDAVQDLMRFRKAEALLDIMEANNINKTMKGM